MEVISIPFPRNNNGSEGYAGGHSGAKTAAAAYYTYTTK